MCDDYCAKYLFGNSTAAECVPCPFGCYECPNGPLADCLACNPVDNRQLVNGVC